MAGLLLGALALAAFFSYAIVMETKTGVEGLNAQVQQHGSKFADSMGVTKVGLQKPGRLVSCGSTRVRRQLGGALCVSCGLNAPEQQQYGSMFAG